MAINGRAKGNKAERVAAGVLKKWANKEFARTPSSGGLQWKSSNSKGDIVCTTEGHYFPFCIEVKSYKKIDFAHLMVPNIKGIDIIDYWEQARRDATLANKIPMLMMRYNGLPKEFFFVVMEQNFLSKLAPSLLLLNLEHTLKYKSPKYNLVIFRSDEFFSLPYKEIKLKAKQYLNYGKKRSS